MEARIRGYGGSHASLLTKEQADLFVAREAPRNPDWTFEVRPA